MKFKNKGPIVFTTDQAPGAIPNGTPIVKVFSEERDANPVGTTGVVLGSMSDGERTGYFVEWQTMPGVPVFVAEFKIGRQQ
ncbi:hypothetical protein [Bradyrhizobium sp. 150]|uniref:hypothetical protein n=1 Tax=Bradyrhizobium sp. 150 TaxID=2782625 RepID=UPI001FF706B3|nr:hypothetical protein [Bradyrhizobium sp. 150]MCK1670337.1 hypothetical protein [Bradyrhizobium sp. 150]